MLIPCALHESDKMDIKQTDWRQCWMCPYMGGPNNVHSQQGQNCVFEDNSL